MNEKYDLCDIDESYLHTVSMTELFDSAYQSKPPIIDGALRVSRRWHQAKRYYTKAERQR